MKRKLRVGLFGIGLDVYWSQFAGLKRRIDSHLSKVESLLARDYADIVNLGIIDTPEKAMQAGHDFRSADVDIIFLYVSTYALSSTVLPVVQRSKVPVIILNLQPTESIDFKTFNALANRTKMTGLWLEYCNACPVPEIANVFRRCKIDFHEIDGVLENDAIVESEIDGWLQAANVANQMRSNRLGLLGHYYNGMLDTYTDMTLQLATFGGHIELLEMELLAQLRRKVGRRQIVEKMKTFEEVFDIQSGCSKMELERAAKTSVVLDELVRLKNLGSMAYFYAGSGNAEHEDIITSIILGTSLLTSKNVPVAGEFEIKNVQAMKILDCFGAGGSFTEYVTTDFKDDVVLLGHDGPGHMRIAQGKTKVRPLEVYHGKIGSGLSVEMSVRYGDVTLLSVIEHDGSIALLHAQGVSEAGEILEIGNTNSRYRFPIGAREFMSSWNKNGPAHHCAIGVGKLSSLLDKLAKLLGIESIRVC